MNHDWPSALARARAHAPFLRRLLDRFPDLAALLEQGRGDEALAAARAFAEGDAEAAVRLRRERSALALVLGVGDLAGAFPLTQVMTELSDFADRALDTAIRAAIAQRTGEDTAQGFTALALGKQGARELNYSSDIDPILLFDPETLPRRSRDEPGEAAQAYARKLTELLSHPSADGYVLRVDLRLRPASEVSPLAIRFSTALSHYESSALAWERAAYIRARAAAGDIAAGEAFLDEIRPFVWRRSLDFTAIEEIRRLTARIRDAYGGPLVPGPGFDLKRGRGGIREVEFFAQTQQLIYGGRMPDLRVRGTRAALDALAARGIVTAEAAQEMGAAYDLLREIEHRLQMVEDRQTHSLPDSTAAIDNVAQLHGLADGQALCALLGEQCAKVAAHYGALLGDGEGEAQAVGGGAVLADDHPLRERAEKWRERYRCLRSEEARRAFEAILPDLLEAFAAAPDPDRAMARWETFLERIPTIINLFRLFEQRPGLLEQVLGVLTLAQPLADSLARHPERLDSLIDRSALVAQHGLDELVERMRASEEDDYESRLGRVRQVVGEERFALGVRLIEGQADPLDIAAALSRLAESAIQVGSDAARDEFARQHGQIADSEIAILGLGRLGGGMLTHASDLDIVYLFTGEIGVDSDGRRPLTASLYYNRLATRITGALSVPTAEGALYEVDTRLRPQGHQGPLAVSVASFAKYQREQAWTWEHMALCRARMVYGSPETRALVEGELRDVLHHERHAGDLREAVLKMRGTMAEHKPGAGALDVKLQRGGLVDCEFIIHFLQLRDHVGLSPHLPEAAHALAAAGLVASGFVEAERLLTRVLIAARLLAPDGVEPHPAAAVRLAVICGFADYPALLRGVAEARQEVAQQWCRTFGETLET